MFGVSATDLPTGALLEKYRRDGNYTDCWTTTVAQSLSHSQFVEAFYTTWVFKLERFILRWLVNRPSTDEGARQLAAGQAEGFAAWFVEGRAEAQLLLSDFRKQTRSWLMVVPESGGGTRLYFGSAVVTNKSGSLGVAAKALLGFHKLYSVVLLAACARRCTK